MIKRAIATLAITLGLLTSAAAVAPPGLSGPDGAHVVLHRLLVAHVRDTQLRVARLLA